jgi:hypothetical protein
MDSKINVWANICNYLSLVLGFFILFVDSITKDGFTSIIQGQLTSKVKVDVITKWILHFEKCLKYEHVFVHAQFKDIPKVSSNP